MPVDDLPERLRRFIAEEWPAPPPSRHFVGSGSVSYVAMRRREEWHLARCDWADEHGVDVADLPDDTPEPQRRGSVPFTFEP